MILLSCIDEFIVWNRVPSYLYCIISLLIYMENIKPNANNFFKLYGFFLIYKTFENKRYKWYLIHHITITCIFNAYVILILFRIMKKVTFVRNSQSFIISFVVKKKEKGWSLNFYIKLPLHFYLIWLTSLKCRSVLLIVYVGGSTIVQYVFHHW